MKRIEDIEKLSPEELEAASRDIAVPEGLQQRIADALLAETSLQEDAPAQRSGQLLRWGMSAAVAIAAACAAVLLIRRPNTPSDSFDDPMLAYAQVEQTFQYISDKMSGGIDLALSSQALASKPAEIINKINGK